MTFAPTINKLFAAAYSANAVLIVDPVTNTTDTTTLSGFGTGALGYWGVAFEPNVNQVFMVPHNSDALLVVDIAVNANALLPFRIIAELTGNIASTQTALASTQDALSSEQAAQALISESLVSTQTSLSVSEAALASTQVTLISVQASQSAAGAALLSTQLSTQHALSSMQEALVSSQVSQSATEAALMSTINAALVASESTATSTFATQAECRQICCCPRPDCLQPPRLRRGHATRQRHVHPRLR
jgi:hypothetical protein